MKNLPALYHFFSTTPFHSFLGVGISFACIIFPEALRFLRKVEVDHRTEQWPQLGSLGGKKRCRCSSQQEKCPAPERLHVKWMLNLVDAKCETELQTRPENWKLWGWWNYRIIHTWNNQADDILRIGYDCHDSHVDSATRRLIWGIWVKWRMATLTWQITSIAERYPSYTEFYMHVCMQGIIWRSIWRCVCLFGLNGCFTCIFYITAHHMLDVHALGDYFTPGSAFDF